MEFAINYSRVLAGLVRTGKVRVNRFKCPAWPDLLAEAGQLRPVYVHFPLIVGGGAGYALDDEKKQPADLEQVADLLESTGTPLVNTHFILDGGQYSDVPRESREPWHIRRVIDAALRDLEPLIRRFGVERVTVENVINEYGWLDLVALPEVIQRLLEECGCGFLFDLSHARLTARNFGMDERAFIRELPLERIREIHITGLQPMKGALYEQLMAAGDPGGYASLMAGRWMDHLPMSEADWPELEWMMSEIRAGERWGQPWVVACEYGGMGGFWDLVTEESVYLEQLARMEKMVSGE